MNGEFQWWEILIFIAVIGLAGKAFWHEFTGEGQVEEEKRDDLVE